MMPRASGRGSVARARITLDIADFIRAAQIAIKTAQQLRDSVVTSFTKMNMSINRSSANGLKQLAQGFREADRAMQQFNKTDLGRVTQGLDAIASRMKYISATAGIISGLGLREAQNLYRQNALLGVFSRTQVSLRNNQEQIRNFAEQTSQSYLTSLEAANQILPTTNRYRIDLQKTLGIVQRLAILDPVQGTQGAAFALRELMSGYGRSLAARFELPLNRVNAIFDAAAGDPNKIVDGLDRLIDGLGLTEEAFLELQRSGANSFTRLQGVLRETIAVAFTPALQAIIPLADGLNEFLQSLSQTSPELLKFVSLGLLFVTAVTPMILIVSNLAKAFGAMAIAIGVSKSVLAGFLGIVGVATLAAAATLLGTVGGLWAGQQLADNSPSDRVDPRLRSDSGINPHEWLTIILREITVIIITAWTELVRVTVTVGINIFGRIWQALSSLPAILQMGGALIQLAFSGIVNSLGVLLAQLALLLPAGDLQNTAAQGAIDLIAAAQSIHDAGKVQLENANNTLDAWELTFDEVISQLDAGLVDLQRNALLAVTNFLFPETRANTQTSSWRDDFIVHAGDAVSELSQDLIGLRDAANTAKLEIADLNEDWAREDQQLNDSRGLEDSRRFFDEQLQRARAFRDFAQTMDREEADFYADRQRRARDFYANLAEEEQDFNAEQLEIEEDYLKDSVELTKEYGETIARIERDTRENVADAARRLDASGVSEAYRQGSQALQDAADQFNKEKQQRLEAYQEQLADNREQYDRQRADSIKAFERQRADELQQYNQRRERARQDFFQRLRDEDQDRFIRLQRLIEDRRLQDQIERDARNRKIQEIWAAALSEALAWNAMLTNFRNAMNIIRMELNGIATGGGIGGTGGGTGWTGGGRAMPTFERGGMPPLNRPVLMNERGMEAVVFTTPAKIFSAENIMSSGIGSNRQNGGGFGINIGSIAPQFGMTEKQLTKRLISVLENFFNSIASE